MPFVCPCPLPNSACPLSLPPTAAPAPSSGLYGTHSLADLQCISPLLIEPPPPPGDASGLNLQGRTYYNISSCFYSHLQLLGGAGGICGSWWYLISQGENAAEWVRRMSDARMKTPTKATRAVPWISFQPIWPDGEGTRRLAPDRWHWRRLIIVYLLPC